MSQAKEKGLKVEKIFKYFQKEGASADDDITPDDFESAMKTLGWSITPSELAVLIDHFDEDKNGTVSMEEFMHYCYNIPHLAWKAERIRYEREQALKAPKPSINDAVEVEVTPPPSPTYDEDGNLVVVDAGPAPETEPEYDENGALVTSASAPAIASGRLSPIKSPPKSPKKLAKSYLCPDQIYAGQKPLWKSKQFLTLKIGYQESMKVVSVSAKDADDVVFEPMFVDAKRILEEKADAIKELVDAEIAKKQASPKKKEVNKDTARAVQAEIVRNELANYVIRRVGTDAANPSVLVLSMLGSDGALKASDIVYAVNPGVHALSVVPANHSRRPSIEDFNAMADQVAEARDAAANEREAGSQAMDRLRKSLDAFQISYVKPFKEMTKLEQLKFLLVRFGFKHQVNKVTHRLQRSPCYKKMLKEQAAKQQALTKRRPSLV